MLTNLGRTERGFWDYVNYKTCKGAISGGIAGALVGAYCGFLEGSLNNVFLSDKPVCRKVTDPAFNQTEWQECDNIRQNQNIRNWSTGMTLGGGVGMFIGGTLGATTAFGEIVADKAIATAKSLYGRVKKAF